MLEEAIQFFRGRKKANLTIVIINVLVFAVLELLGNTQSSSFMLAHGAAWSPYILEGEYWRLVTSMFLHFGFVHLLYNMLCLIYLGDMLETAAGPWRYLVIYLGGGILGNVLGLFWEMYSGRMAVSAGASGGVFAVIGACWYISIRERGRIGNIAAKRIGVMTVLMLLQGFTEPNTDNAAHLGGAVAGFLLALLVYRKKRK